MSAQAKSAATTPIPVQLSEMEFKEFIVADHGVCCQCLAGRARPSGRGAGANKALPPRLPRTLCTSLAHNACWASSAALQARPRYHGIPRDQLRFNGRLD
jgi:hypothetical protein